MYSRDSKAGLRIPVQDGTYWQVIFTALPCVLRTPESPSHPYSHSASGTGMWLTSRIDDIGQNMAFDNVSKNLIISARTGTRQSSSLGPYQPCHEIEAISIRL